jgi:hypothetical protein
MKDCIKSEFTKDTLYWNIPFYVFILLISVVSIVGWIRKFLLNELSISVLCLAILLLAGLHILLINAMKIRYLLISREKMTYYSFWRPFGKILYFSNYTGKIITDEFGITGRCKIVYLVDKNNTTTFKIMGLHYKNFDEINDAIPLKKISFSPKVETYFKLLFTGKITVKEKNKNDRRKNKNAAQTISKIIAAVAAIGLLLFVVGMIIKILSKIM